MKKRELKPGDVVQISPDLPDCFFRGCYMTVTEAKHFGAMGFVLIPKTRTEPAGVAYFRCSFENMEYIGHAAWTPVREADET